MPRPKSTTRPRRPVQSPQTELAKIGKALSPDADLDAIIAKLEAIEADKLKVMWDNRIYHFKEGDIWRPNPAQQLILDAWKNPQYRTFTFCGANRVGKCQTYQTLIETVKGEVSIGSLFEKKESFEVFAWDGKKRVIAKASPPFKKAGLHKCYRITMSDGRWIEAADHHRVLLTLGWFSVQEIYDASPYLSSRGLHLKSLDVLLGSNSESFPSVHGEGDQRSAETQSSLPGHYFEDLRPDGGLLPMDQGSGQVPVPSQGDALTYKGPVSYWGGLESKHTNIPRQVSVPPSSSGGLHRSVDLFVGWLYRNVGKTLSSFFGDASYLSNNSMLKFLNFHKIT